MKNASKYLLDFQDIDRKMLAVVGGKGGSLGELSRMEDVQVPEGFCVTTDAYKDGVGHSETLRELLDQLALLKVDNRIEISEISAKIRKVIEETAIPNGIEKEIARQLQNLGEEHAYAVRSSATAEDLPTASFAGQHDSYLNTVGKAAILKSISRCWASLYTDRAVAYRLQNGFDHRKVYLSVVIQKMIFPDVAGILFTADPVSSNRKVVSIDASFGLGESLVSGLVNADHYKVRAGQLIARKVSTKKRAVYAVKSGGMQEAEVGSSRQNRQALTEEQILQLERVGRKIEAHFGCPQDIEWGLVDDTFFVVQSRPITTLFPIPEANNPGNAGPDPRVYVSVGHNQMMTDALKPLGISFFQLTTRAVMHQAGGRLFVDVTPHLAAPDSRKKLIETFGQGDLLIKDALLTIAGRKDFIKPVPNGKIPATGFINNNLSWRYLASFENKPALVPDLIRQSQTSIAALEQAIQAKSGSALFDFIREDIPQLRQMLFSPQGLEVIKIALYATAWINKKMETWLGERNAADVLTQSVSHNITSEMGLALLDVADVIRPYPEVIAFLQEVKDDHFLDELVNFEGGQETRKAIEAFLTRYGMRCVGEIDISKARWSEKPAQLAPILLGNIKNVEPGAARQKFEQGRQEAMEKEQDLLERLMALPDGRRKARETKRMIGLLRNFIGYREYPKYGMVNRYFVYKQALLQEMEKLVQARVVPEKEDGYYLTFEEFREVVRTQTLDLQIIRQRKEEHEINEKRTPPRVITSEGEIITGQYRRENLPTEAMAGLAVSSGLIEGRARVVLNLEDADLEAGDVLVTTFTDPSWTPLFVSIKGLVTEVGGLMTHGAVIAREYGLPAVVGVENATRLIKDGQRIRVNGTDGYVEIL
ncbi:phosphoenolpyruvate synthase [Larkinella sp. GY13]|uniref:phosphoenolpyruvate synthase n=1 Tax=Larkinella sp. GY13 TaxID=3453720 RepID=UPI003EEA5F29